MVGIYCDLIAYNNNSKNNNDDGDDNDRRNGKNKKTCRNRKVKMCPTIKQQKPRVSATICIHLLNYNKSQANLMPYISKCI